MTGAGCIDDDELLAFVDGALPPGPAELVGAHLASCVDCRTVLAEVARSGSAAPDGPDAALRRGSRLGRYVLTDLIGSGGMGVVYAAEDPTLGRRVAVKLLRGGANAGRFEHERRILAGLEHPQIARLLDGGQTEAGRPYLVMELVEGAPIVQHCDAHALPLTERLRLFRRVCGAVQYAHQNLVVHRDLKPTNILVTAAGEPKLLDFGIAKLLEPDDSARLTATGLQPMTPAFASPEQVRREPVTTSSDVYALGIILYELLTGLSAYRLQGAGLDELLEAVRTQEPERPSAAIRRATPEALRAREGTLERLRRKLQGDLDDILLRALRKEPQERYATAAELSEDLRRHLEGLPVAARRGNTAYRATKFVRRHKAGVAAAAAAVVSLAAGTFATAWQARVAARERDLAQARFRDVRQLAHAVLFDYHDGIAQLPGSTPVRERLVKDALGYLGSLAASAEGDASLQRELATAYLKVGDVQGYPFGASLGDSAGALRSYRSAQEIGLALLRALPGDLEATRLLAASHLKVGDLLWVSGDGPGALAAYQAAISLNEALARRTPAAREDRYELSMDYLAQGLALAEQGQLDPALASLRRTLALREALVAEAPDVRMRRGVAAAHIQLADVHTKRGETAQSLAEYERGMALYEALVAEAPLYRGELGPGYQRMGVALQAAGDLPRAVEVFRKTLALSEERFLADPKDAVAKRNLAGAYSTLADPLGKTGGQEEAGRYFRKALQLTRELAAADPANAQAARDVGLSLFELGRFALRTGHLDEAEKAHREGLELSERLLAASPTAAMARADVADFLGQLGRIEVATRRWEPARADLQRAAALYEGVVKDAPKDASYLAALAGIHGQLAQVHAALAAHAPEHRALACAFHRRALAAWLGLKEKGLLAHDDAREPDAEARALAECERG